MKAADGTTRVPRTSSSASRSRRRRSCAGEDFLICGSTSSLGSPSRERSPRGVGSAPRPALRRPARRRAPARSISGAAPRPRCLVDPRRCRGDEPHAPGPSRRSPERPPRTARPGYGSRPGTLAQARRRGAPARRRPHRPRLRGGHASRRGPRHARGLRRRIREIPQPLGRRRGVGVPYMAGGERPGRCSARRWRSSSRWPEPHPPARARQRPAKARR